MTFEEALAAIMEALPDVEKFDEHIGVIKETMSATPGVDIPDGSNFEAKYNELKEKYITRFGEVTAPAANLNEPDVPKEEDTPEDIDIASLDFDASTE